MLESKTIDKNVPIPLYFQLKKLITAEIENGEYPVDTLIPTESELCEMFGISRTVVRQAILELVQEGRLYRIKSKGTFVARPKVEQQISHRYKSYNDEIREKGGEPSIEVLALEVVDMPAEFERLRGEGKQKAVRLVRTHCSSGTPIVYTETYFPYDQYAFLLEHDFTTERLYPILGKYPALRVEHISRDIEAVAANSEDCRVLGIHRGKPVHLFKTIGYNAAGEAVEFSSARYRGDRSSFHIDVVISGEYD